MPTEKVSAVGERFRLNPAFGQAVLDALPANVAVLAYVAHLVENSRHFSRCFLQISRIFGSGNAVLAL
jgi:hypothetical protein